MPHHKGGIVGLPPGTAFDDRKVGRLESPFNRIPIDNVGIHSHIISAVTNERLHCAIINELSFAVTFVVRNGPDPHPRPLHHHWCEPARRSDCHGVTRVEMTPGNLPDVRGIRQTSVPHGMCETNRWINTVVKVLFSRFLKTGTTPCVAPSHWPTQSRLVLSHSGCA